MEHKVIQNGFEEYLNQIGDADWEGIGKKIYPKLFDLLPKEQLIEAFKGIQSQGFWMRFGEIEKFELSELDNDIPEQVSKVYFANYHAPVVITLDEDIEYNQEDLDRLQAVFSYNPKYSDITFDSEKREFSMKSSSHLIAVKSDKWYYLEIEPKQLAIVESMFSKSISSQIAKLITR